MAEAQTHHAVINPVKAPLHQARPRYPYKMMAVVRTGLHTCISAAKNNIYAAAQWIVLGEYAGLAHASKLSSTVLDVDGGSFQVFLGSFY